MKPRLSHWLPVGVLSCGLFLAALAPARSQTVVTVTDAGPLPASAFDLSTTLHLTQVNGTLTNGVDMFKLTIGDPSRFSATMAVATVTTYDPFFDEYDTTYAFDSQLYLFNSAGYQVAYNDDFNGLNAHLGGFTGSAGIYYLAVTRYFSSPQGAQSSPITGWNTGNSSGLDYVLTLSLEPRYWQGGSSGLWSASNWTSDITGAAAQGTLGQNTDVVFSANNALNQNTTLDTNFSIHSLTVNDPAAVTIGGTNTLTISSTVAQAITVNSGAGKLTISANLAFAGSANTITVSNTAGAEISGVISGTQGLVKDGAGKLTLSGVNVYSGGTKITGGIVSVSQDANLGDISGALTLDGGTLQTTASFTTARQTTLAAGGGALDIASGTTLTHSGVISGAGALEKLGAGTLTLSGVNTYSGGTKFTAGIVSVSDDANLGDVAGALTFDGGTLQTTASFTTARQTTLNAGGGALDIASGTTLTHSGVISGGGALEKLGDGTLTLTGANTYTGDTAVNGGSLIVNGSIASATTTVGSLGTLGGSGSLGGAVINGGIVSPGNSPGTLTITGPYTQSSGGTLKIEIAGRNAGEHDLLAVGGAANLGGTLQLVRLNGFQLAAGDSIVFLTATGGVVGNFSTETNEFATGTVVKGKVVYAAGQVSLDAVLEPFAKVPELIAEQFPAEAARLQAFLRGGLSSNQLAVAQALDALVQKEGHNSRLISYLTQRLLPELPGDFDRIAPEELAAIYQTAVSYATVQGLNIQRRADEIRSGSSGFSSQGFALNGQTPSYSGGFGAAGPTGDSSKDSKLVYAPAEENRWGVFLSGTGEWVDVEGDGNVRGYDVTSAGFTLGLDYKVTPHLAVGLSAGYAGASADLADGGRVGVNGGKLGLYATYFTGGFYSDVSVGGGYNSYDTQRRGLQGTARGSTDGGEFNVLFGTGYDFTAGALKIGPTATFNYTLVGLDGFDERGSLAPLRIPGQSAESVRSAFGVKASYDWKVGGLLVKPEVRAAWQHEYGDEDYALDSKFANGAGNTFTVRGPRIGRDSVLVSAGVAVQFNARVSSYLYYDAQLARENYQSQSVTGGIRVSF